MQFIPSFHMFVVPQRQFRPPSHICALVPFGSSMGLVVLAKGGFINYGRRGSKKSGKIYALFFFIPPPSKVVEILRSPPYKVELYLNFCDPHPKHVKCAKLDVQNVQKLTKAK